MNHDIKNWLIFIVCVPILYYCWNIFPSQTTYSSEALVSTGIFATFSYIVYFIIFLITTRYEKCLKFFYKNPQKKIEKIILFKSNKNNYYEFMMLSALLDFFILLLAYTSPTKLLSVISLGAFLNPIIEQLSSNEGINTPYLLLTHVPTSLSLLLPIIGPAVLYVLYISNKYRETINKKFVGSRALVAFLWASPFFLFLMRISMKYPETVIFDLSLMLSVISSLIAGLSYGAVVQLYHPVIFSKFKSNEIPKKTRNEDLSIPDSKKQLPPAKNSNTIKKEQKENSKLRTLSNLIVVILVALITYGAINAYEGNLNPQYNYTPPNLTDNSILEQFKIENNTIKLDSIQFLQGMTLQAIFKSTSLSAQNPITVTANFSLANGTINPTVWKTYPSHFYLMFPTSLSEPSQLLDNGGYATGIIVLNKYDHPQTYHTPTDEIQQIKFQFEGDHGFAILDDNDLSNHSVNGIPVFTDKDMAKLVSNFTKIHVNSSDTTTNLRTNSITLCLTFVLIGLGVVGTKKHIQTILIWFSKSR